MFEVLIVVSVSLKNYDAKAIAGTVVRTEDSTEVWLFGCTL